MAKPNPQAARSAFTTPGDEDGKNWILLENAQHHEDILVMIGGKEIGGTTGYEDFQDYLETRSKKTLWQMKTLLGNQTHLEIAAASTEEIR